MMKSIRIGTRQSPLALRQTAWVCGLMQRALRDVCLETCPIVTTGDIVSGPLHAHGGKGLFVKELDQALLAGDIDCAVHSLKDVPGVLADGIAIAAIPARASPWDLLIGREALTLATLPRGARVGTSSPRRQWQLVAQRPDVVIVPLRGNVETRLRKLGAGDFDAIILAEAGVERLGCRPPHATRLSLEEMIPAVGQGALAITVRAEAHELMAALRAACEAPIDAAATGAERALLAAIGGDCHTPLAGYASVIGDMLHLTAFLATPDGARSARASVRGPITAPDVLGKQVAQQLRVELEKH